MDDFPPGVLVRPAPDPSFAEEMREVEADFFGTPIRDVVEVVLERLARAAAVEHAD